ncbi:MAG: response regulator [Candidatus Omnitrophica bacterium]|nr:response regulator [Candidatus Omnitrophota bacterium]
MAKIWLVEDDQNLANLTKVALAKKGYQVMVFYESLQVLAEAKKQKPDLILMDVMLPGQSGPETVTALRNDPNFRNIPVIFLTALLSTEESALGMTIDKVNYKTLGKPYDIKRLLEVVETSLIKK